jgi:predicted nuclease of predicted toxin-antitoxin system
MKFLLDMGISPKTGTFLRSLGHEALHLQEEGLGRLSDPMILEKAAKEGFILLTHDLDFGDLLAASGANLPSVVLFRLRNMHPEKVNFHLRAIIPPCENDLNEGAVITVTEGGFRIRKLPFEFR